MNNIIIIDGVKYRRIEEEAQKPKTGYERVDSGEEYYSSDGEGTVANFKEEGDVVDNCCYSRANYYNDQTLAENNARADALMRRLRQWQALNDEPVDWTNNKYKYYIHFDYERRRLFAGSSLGYRELGLIFFSSREKTLEALDVFHNELTWYYTEYQQRLDEPKRG